MLKINSKTLLGSYITIAVFAVVGCKSNMEDQQFNTGNNGNAAVGKECVPVVCTEEQTKKGGCIAITCNEKPGDPGAIITQNATVIPVVTATVAQVATTTTNMGVIVTPNPTPSMTPVVVNGKPVIVSVLVTTTPAGKQTGTQSQGTDSSSPVITVITPEVVGKTTTDGKTGIDGKSSTPTPSPTPVSNVSQPGDGKVDNGKTSTGQSDGGQQTK